MNSGERSYFHQMLGIEENARTPEWLSSTYNTFRKAALKLDIHKLKRDHLLTIFTIAQKDRTPETEPEYSKSENWEKPKDENAEADKAPAKKATKKTAAA
jgi:hypothetical protein